MKEVRAGLKVWITQWRNIPKFHRRDGRGLNKRSNNGGEEVKMDRAQLEIRISSATWTVSSEREGTSQVF